MHKKAIISALAASKVQKVFNPDIIITSHGIYSTWGRFLNFLGEKTFACIMPQERSIDIDSELDLKLAEILIKNDVSNFVKG